MKLCHQTDHDAVGVVWYRDHNVVEVHGRYAHSIRQILRHNSDLAQTQTQTQS
jgi:hypothetical protein